MGVKTYWEPYPSLLKKLGFESRTHGWVNRSFTPARFIYWGKDYEDEPYLEMKESHYTVFYGELSSEEDFHTILRLVKWEPMT